jgi:hypothetical protein
MNRRRERGEYHALLGSDEDISFMVRLQAQEKHFKGLLIPTALKSGLLLLRYLKSSKAVTAALLRLLCYGCFLSLQLSYPANSQPTRSYLSFRITDAA